MKRLDELKRLLALEIATDGSSQYIADLLVSIERAERTLRSAVFEAICVPYPGVMTIQDQYANWQKSAI